MNGKFYKNTKFMNTLLVLIVFISEIISSEVPRPRGVSISRASLYPADKDFTCFDGSKTIPFTRVNDDYCDCLDGSDEPGTSACPQGTFHCTNAGHRPLNLPASRVNDGICDCCDGTDEYASETSCQNNCIELGRSAREAAARRAELVKAGKQIRAELSKKGINLKQDKQARLTELQNNKDEAQKLKQEKEALKKEVEDLEHTALEYYRKLEEEARHQKEEEQDNSHKAEATEAFNKYDVNQDGWVEISEVKSSVAFDRDNNGEVTDEEAKFYLNLQESVDLDTFITKCWKTLKPFVALENKQEGTSEEAEHLQDRDESDEDNEEHDYEDEEEPQEPETTEAPSHIQYDEETQKLVDRASAARNEYQEANRLVNDIEREINDIQEYMKKDLGTEEEFATLEGHCFEYEDHEYIYKLCPFDYATQHPKHGGSDVRLGSWGYWSGPEPNKYDEMIYEKGQACWNGPQRTAVVRLNCGKENKLVGVSEPNRCEYVFKFDTPAACYEAPVKENEGLHDEL